MNKAKLWRLERGLSQYELATVSGVPRHVIQLCEGGVCLPSEKHRAALARALGVELSKLFTGSLLVKANPHPSKNDSNASGRVK